MNNKKTKTSKDLKHLEDAMLSNPVSSANDCTGFVNTLPENNETADALSDLLNVPTSRKRKSK